MSDEQNRDDALTPSQPQSLARRSAAIVRRGLQALIGQEDRVDVRKDLARRLLQQLITLATEAIYSERFEEFDAIIAWLSNDKPGIAFLRAYVAIQTATQLAEPLNDADVDRTLDVLRSSEQRVDAPEFQAILDVHKELAEIHWLRKTHAILKGKLANKNDEYSYEGRIYSLEREKKGPTTKEERARYEPICNQLADLNRQIEEKELSLWKDQDEQEYNRYKEELESRALREEIDRESCPLRHKSQPLSHRETSLVAVIIARLWFLRAPPSLIIGVYLLITGLGRLVEESYRGEPQTAIYWGL